MFHVLCSSRAAPTTSAVESASWTPTSTYRIGARAPMLAGRPACCSASRISARPAISAGSRPETSATASVDSSAATSTGRLIERSARRGMESGSTPRLTLTSAHASARPAAAPTDASSRPSVSVCRSSRARLAPSARRTPSSPVRPAARAIWRLATLAQATSSSRPTAMTSRRMRCGRSSPTIQSNTGSSRALHPPLSAGNSRARAPATAASSACASSGVTPAARRPTTARRLSPRPSVAGSAASGTHRSTSREKPTSCGAMPTTVRATPSTEIGAPIRSSRPAYRRRQSPSLTIAACGPPGRSSAAVNERPLTSGSPSTWKVFAVAASPSTCAASLPSVRLAGASLNAANDRRVTCCRHDTRFGTETENALMFRAGLVS